MWREVLHILEQRGQLGDAFPLQCNHHPDDSILVREPGDFAILAGDGGCARQCIDRLPCGHACKRR
jgi:hypothetical protein